MTENFDMNAWIALNKKEAEKEVKRVMRNYLIVSAIKYTVIAVGIYAAVKIVNKIEDDQQRKFDESISEKVEAE